MVGLSDEPGEFNFTSLPDEEAGVLEIPYATVQCYLARVEPELLGLVTRADSIDGLLDALRRRGFRVVSGRPRPTTFARL